MKRIIDGKTYNTDTSTLVARSWWNDWQRGDVEMQGDLYLTRGGAFFVVVTEPNNEDARATFEPMDRDAVDKWLATGEVEVFDTTIFQEPEEAAAEREPEATLYIRVPRSLKDRLEAEAKDDDVSLNAWVMRCVERCATFDPTAKRALVKLWNEIGALNATPDGYTQEQVAEMMGSAVSAFNDLCGWLGYSDGQLAGDSGSALLARDIPHREPYREGA